jgi:hypothetical protein
MRFSLIASRKTSGCKYLRLTDCVLLLFLGWISSCNFLPAHRFTQHAPQGVTKKISFAILEDYDKGDDLREIAKDFQLMRELEIDVLRCSFGWDDYEPARGQYDFAWLIQFVKLAAQYDIKLRPYIGYTPRWAGTDGSGDGADWNNPPADYRAWYNFVYNLADALREFPNVLSYEIYNEQNSRQWWDGSIEEYKETLRHGAAAIRAANPSAQVVLGGLVFPDVDWLHSVLRDGYARYYDITAFHAYPETGPKAMWLSKIISIATIVSHSCLTIKASESPNRFGLTRWAFPLRPIRPNCSRPIGGREPSARFLRTPI